MDIKKIDIPNRELQSIGVQPPQSLRMFKGVSTLDPLSMDKSYSPQLKNLSGSGFPGLQTRPGYTALGAALTGRILGLGVWKDQQLHAAANGVWSKWNGTTWDTLGSSLNTSAMWSFCNFQGNFADINLLGANGVNAVKKWDGTTLTDLSGAPAEAKYIDQHDNRVYVAKKNAGTNNYNTVAFSALRKATDWTTLDDAGEIVVETDNGEEINGLKAGNRHLLIFKPSSVHELWGTNPLNYQRETVATDIGLLSNQCAVVIQGTVYWMDRNSAYLYGGARPRKDFALPVKGYYDNMNPAALSKASAGTDGTNLYLSIPSTGTEADTVLEYDTQYQVWYVWKDLTPTLFANMAGDWYLGDSLGRVLKMGGSTDNGAVINYEWVSSPFGGGSLAQRLQWYRMWYVADVPAGSSMNVYLSKSAEGDVDWTLVKSVSANELQSGRIIIPINTVANANWVRVKFAGSGPMKITEFDYQQRELPMY